MRGLKLALASGAAAVLAGLLLAGAAVSEGATGGPVLIVAAHPDDETLGFAGTIESALAQGRQVYVAVVTNGAGGTSVSDSGYCGAASGSPASTAPTAG